MLKRLTFEKKKGRKVHSIILGGLMFTNSLFCMSNTHSVHFSADNDTIQTSNSDNKGLFTGFAGGFALGSLGTGLVCGLYALYHSPSMVENMIKNINKDNCIVLSEIMYNEIINEVDLNSADEKNLKSKTKILNNWNKKLYEIFEFGKYPQSETFKNAVDNFIDILKKVLSNNGIEIANFVNGEDSKIVLKLLFSLARINPTKEEENTVTEEESYSETVEEEESYSEIVEEENIVKEEVYRAVGEDCREIVEEENVVKEEVYRAVGEDFREIVEEENIVKEEESYSEIVEEENSIEEFLKNCKEISNFKSTCRLPIPKAEYINDLCICRYYHVNYIWIPSKQFWTYLFFPTCSRLLTDEEELRNKPQLMPNRVFYDRRDLTCWDGTQWLCVKHFIGAIDPSRADRPKYMTRDEVARELKCN